MTETLIEGTIDKVSFDFAVEMLIAGAIVRLEGPTLLSQGHGGDVTFDPESAADAASSLVRMLATEVSVSIAHGSTLEIEGSDQKFRLSTKADETLESWSVTTADGSRFVAGSGDVSKWSL